MTLDTVPAAASKPLNLLLIEDDDGDAKAVQRAFRTAKVRNTITRAHDGMEALQLLRGGEGGSVVQAPYILLVDINMPRMNGIEFVRELRRDPALAQSLVFMLTTSKTEEDKIAAYNLNVAGFIYKETAGHDFLKLVNMIDRYWCIVEVPA